MKGEYNKEYCDKHKCWCVCFGTNRRFSCHSDVSLVSVVAIVKRTYLGL